MSHATQGHSGPATSQCVAPHPGTSAFVEHLRMERLRRRIRQGVLAGQIKVRQAALSMWENAERIPPDEHLRRWAAALQVEVPEGVTGTVPAVAECGTVSGYGRHFREKTPTCEPCRRAHATYMKDYRVTRRTLAGA